MEMTVLNNIQIEYKEAETYIKRHDRSELNHIISKILKDLEIKEEKERELKARKENIKNDLVQAFKEVDLIKKGKMKGTDLKDLIKELRENV